MVLFFRKEQSLMKQPGKTMVLKGWFWFTYMIHITEIIMMKLTCPVLIVLLILFFGYFLNQLLCKIKFFIKLNLSEL